MTGFELFFFVRVDAEIYRAEIDLAESIAGDGDWLMDSWEGRRADWRGKGEGFGRRVSRKGLGWSGRMLSTSRWVDGIAMLLVRRMERWEIGGGKRQFDAGRGTAVSNRPRNLVVILRNESLLLFPGETLLSTVRILETPAWGDRTGR